MVSTRLFLHFLCRPCATRHDFGAVDECDPRNPAARPDEALAVRRQMSWIGRRHPSLVLRASASRARRGRQGGVLLITDGPNAARAIRLPLRWTGHRSCRRLIWLNPLLRWAFARQGVQTMLPYVDELRPIQSGIDGRTGARIVGRAAGLRSKRC